jgi:hypothetical protein
MVGGAAYYAGRKVAQGENQNSTQEERLAMLEAQQAAQPQYAPPPAAPPLSPAASQQSMVDKLTDLKKLLDAGILTQSEFDVQKAKVLGELR